MLISLNWGLGDFLSYYDDNDGVDNDEDDNDYNGKTKTFFIGFLQIIVDGNTLIICTLRQVEWSCMCGGILVFLPNPLISQFSL